MAVSVNIRHRSRRLFVAAWMFAAIILFGGILVTGKADASCGDYLLHGPVHSSSTGDYANPSDHLGSGSLSNHREMADDSSPQTPTSPQPPTSPCANGNCHSAPPHPPANSPTRTVFIKQPVAIDTLASSDCIPDTMGWLYPADGLCPEGPSIAVDLPPPERGC